MSVAGCDRRRRHEVRRGALWLATAMLAGGMGAGALTPRATGAQEVHVLTVIGLGGDPDYREAFLQWGLRIRTAVLERFGLPQENVTLLSEAPEMDPAVAGRSDREGVESAVAELARRAGPNDRVLVVLIGHGSYRAGEARFNLPGPDLDAREWGDLLTALGDRPVALVNTTSSSGPFVEATAAPNRTVITATKTGGERNETQFARFFAEALEGDAADLDKDGMLSLLEAFTYTRAEIARWYQEENLLLTEHALLDDNGDGEGSEEPSRDGPDGAVAAFFRLVPSTLVMAAPEVMGDSVLVRLMNERTALEARVAQLRARRDEMDREDYESQLEDLLVEIALKSREIEARGGGGTA
jgi:hypothetical protein